MAPIVDGLEQEFQNQITVWRVNADTPDGQELQDILEVRGHPTVVVLDENGRIQNRFFGPQPVDSLRDALQNVLP